MSNQNTSSAPSTQAPNASVRKPERKPEPDRKIEAAPRPKYPTQYLLVQSKTGRPFNRGGLRFESKYPTPVNLADLVDTVVGDKRTTAQEKADRICNEAHLAVSFVDRERYELALIDFRNASGKSDDSGDVVTDSTLRAENEQLLKQNEELRNEISLLKGRLHSPAPHGPIGG